MCCRGLLYRLSSEKASEIAESGGLISDMGGRRIPVPLLNGPHNSDSSDAALRSAAIPVEMLGESRYVGDRSSYFGDGSMVIGERR